MIGRSHCECLEDVEALLKERGLTDLRRHKANSKADVVALLSANVGVALAPSSADLPAHAHRLGIEDANLERPVSVYGVAGRPRAPIASTGLAVVGPGRTSRLRASDAVARDLGEATRPRATLYRPRVPKPAFR
jgi:hypothetical protein